MREDGTWGGNQELYAAARLYQVYVVVHQDQASARIMVIECDRLKPTRFVHVAYHGEDHYDSVRALRDPVEPDALPVSIELDCDGFRRADFAKVRTFLGWIFAAVTSLTSGLTLHHGSVGRRMSLRQEPQARTSRRESFQSRLQKQRMAQSINWRVTLVNS
jgi:hypothetical protein